MTARQPGAAGHADGCKADERRQQLRNGPARRACKAKLPPVRTRREPSPSRESQRYSFGTVPVNAPSVVLPVRLLPDIDTIAPPLASPVSFCVITLFEMRTVAVEPHHAGLRIRDLRIVDIDHVVGPGGLDAGRVVDRHHIVDQGADEAECRDRDRRSVDTDIVERSTT